MPFGQKFGACLKTGFGNVKNFLGNAYTKTKDTLGSLDRTFGDIKKIYGTVAPAIQDLAPEQAKGGIDQINKFMMQGVQGYENVRNKIDDAESQMIGKVGDVMSRVGGVQQKLKNQGYNFDFA